MMRMFALLLALAGVAGALPSAPRYGGLYVVTATAGVAAAADKAPAALTPGKNLFAGDTLAMEGEGFAQLRLAERVDVGLCGPAELGVGTVKRRATQAGGKHWEARLGLKKGCLWVDTRFNFNRPLDLTIELPQGALRVPARSRYVARVDGAREAFWVLDAQGATRAAHRSLMGVGLDLDANTAAARADAGAATGAARADCGCVLGAARRGVPVLVLADDFDKTRGGRPRRPQIAPALVEALSAVSGTVQADLSGSTRLARRASAALKGNDGLARRVGRELKARWVVVGNSVVREVKPAKKGKRRTPLVVKATAEAKIMDVATGEVLAFDSGSTRFAVARGQRREEAATAALALASQRLARYMAFHLENLERGQAHAAALLPMTVDNITTEQAVALRETLSNLEGVQRVLFRKFSKKSLRLDLMLRASHEELVGQLRQLRLDGGSVLAPRGKAPEGGLHFAVAPADAAAGDGADGAK